MVFQNFCDYSQYDNDYDATDCYTAKACPSSKPSGFPTYFGAVANNAGEEVKFQVKACEEKQSVQDCTLDELTLTDIAQCSKN